MLILDFLYIFLLLAWFKNEVGRVLMISKRSKKFTFQHHDWNPFDILSILVSSDFCMNKGWYTSKVFIRSWGSRNIRTLLIVLRATKYYDAKPLRGQTSVNVLLNTRPFANIMGGLSARKINNCDCTWKSGSNEYKRRLKTRLIFLGKKQPHFHLHFSFSVLKLTFKKKT